MKGDFKSAMRLLLRHLPKLDLYGGSVRSDPARFPKSHVGAIVSLICFGAAIALIVLNASRLYSAVVAQRDDGVSNIVSMATEYIKFNAYITDPESGDLTDADDGRWDLPALMIECSSNIEFFNRDARKLYKIELRDNNGIHRSLTSSDKPTPVASGLYKKVSVPRGSVNQDLEPGTEDQQLSVSLAASLGFKELHSGQEIIRVLKNIKEGTKDFFDHKAHAYVRLLPWQMQSVKSCQLQVWLSNQGQYLAMLEAGLLFDRSNYDRKTFTTLATTASTWRPSNFGQNVPYKWTENHVTLLKLSSGMTRADISAFRDKVPSARSLRDGEFMDWRVEFTYLNNFIKVVKDFSCDSEEVFDRKYATVTNDPPNKNATYIVLDAPSAASVADAVVDGKLVWPIPPFYVLLSMEELSEVVQVTAIQLTLEGKQNLTLMRENPIDFFTHGGVFPQDWQCPLSWYNDTKACNCECGVPDPDCKAGKDLPVLACPMPYAKLDTGSFCSISGHCAKEPPQNNDLVLGVSQGCAKIQKPGEIVLRGFVGTNDEYDAATSPGCAPCPGDVPYEGQVSLDSDNRWKCNVRTSGNIHSDVNDNFAQTLVDFLQQSTDAVAARSAAAAPANTAPAPTAPPEGSAGACAYYSSTWQACMQQDLTSVFSAVYIRFSNVGMKFPVVDAADTDKPTVPVEILLGDSVTYKGRIVMTLPPMDDLQSMVIGPESTLPDVPANRFEQIKCLLISSLNYDSTSMDVILLNRRSDGSPVAFRNGVDKNFIVRLGSSLIPILDTVPSEQLTGLAARDGGTGSSRSTTTYFAPNCSEILGGQCQNSKSGDDGIMVTLRLVRPVAVSKGSTRVIRAFDLCQGDAAADTAADAASNSTNGTDDANSTQVATRRRLLQAQTTTAAGEGGTPAPAGQGGGEQEAIDPNDPSTCPAGKRHRIVTTAPLFPDAMLQGAGLTPAAVARRRLLQETTAPVVDEGTPAPGAEGEGVDALYLFPEDRRPIVIIRSRGRVAEVRTVVSAQGNVLELDGHVEGNIYWPATIETTWDAKNHSCTPPHHSCVIPLYNVRMRRSEEAYDPDDRFLYHASTEPSQSPANLDLELALFTVPDATQSDVSTAAREAPSSQTPREGTGAPTAQAPSPPTARRQENRGTLAADDSMQGTPAPGQGGGAVGTDGRLAVGAPGDVLCPNIPVSVKESRVSKKYTAFNWDKWTVSADRDYDIVSCLDRPIRLPACADLGDVPASELKDTCLKAMPPTSTYSFAYKLPVNNKWVVPSTFLKIMRGINLPEFDMDFSLVYNLQYSADTLGVENQFARSMETGDYLDTNNFTIYNGATDFQGLGAGYDAYRNLAQVLPANHPVLRNTLVLGVDPASTIRDLKLAREKTKGKAGKLWPTDEQSIKLILEKFDPMQIEWELSSIGGRSDEQVLVMQPGYEYLLEALLQIRPIYWSDVWESSNIERWERQVVSTAASRTKLSDPAQAHQVIVRYHLEFDPLVRAQTFRKAFTVKSFAESVGAATGFIVIGAMFLNFIRRVRSQGSDVSDMPAEGQQLEYAR